MKRYKLIIAFRLLLLGPKHFNSSFWSGNLPIHRIHFYTLVSHFCLGKLLSVKRAPAPSGILNHHTFNNVRRWGLGELGDWSLNPGKVLTD